MVIHPEKLCALILLFIYLFSEILLLFIYFLASTSSLLQKMLRYALKVNINIKIAKRRCDGEHMYAQTNTYTDTHCTTPRARTHTHTRTQKCHTQTHKCHTQTRKCMHPHNAYIHGHTDTAYIRTYIRTKIG